MFLVDIFDDRLNEFTKQLKSYSTKRVNDLFDVNGTNTLIKRKYATRN